MLRRGDHELPIGSVIACYSSIRSPYRRQPAHLTQKRALGICGFADRPNSNAVVGLSQD